MVHNKLAQLKAVAKSEGWSQWIRSEADERAVLEGCRFSVRTGEHAVGFFQCFLRHSKGEWAGKPFELLPWERDEIVMPLFGWQRADGTRRYRRAGIWVAKKNGKSSLCAGFSLYLLIADNEPGAEIYCAASDRDQAGIVFNEAARMVRSSPDLSNRLLVTPSRKTIAYPQTNSLYRALSADVPTKEGLNIHGLIFDELHAQKTREMWDTLTYGGAARRQPLLISISTAGFDTQSIGFEQYRYAKGVLDGSTRDSSFFAFVREADKDDDWASPETWRKANPSLGVTVREEELGEAHLEARNAPEKENSFRRYRLNQWTEQDVRWLSMPIWNECSGELDLSELEGEPCCAGLDLAKTSDLTALVLAFPREGGVFTLVSHFFMPGADIVAKERADGNVPYRMWAKDGHIDLTDGNVTDYDWVKERIREAAALYDLREVAFDPWNASHFASELIAENVAMVEFRQGYVSMSEPSKEFKRLLLCKKIRHDGNPVLSWMASNVTIRQDPAENIKPIKADQKGRGKKKIDGIIASIMAISRANEIEHGARQYITVL